MYRSLTVLLAAGCVPVLESERVDVVFDVVDAAGTPIRGASVEAGGWVADTDEAGEASLPLSAGRVRLVVRRGRERLFDGIVTVDPDRIGPDGHLAISLPPDRVDLLEEFVADAPPIVVRPPAPYPGLPFTVDVEVPGADEVRLAGDGPGCGAIDAFVSKGDRLAVTAVAPEAGDCALRVRAVYAGEIVELGSSFRVAPAVGAVGPLPRPAGPGVYRAAGVATFADRAVTDEGLAKDPGSLPIRFARVEVRRDFDGVVLGVGHTDGLGVFDVAFQNGGPPGYTVVVRAERDDELLAQRVENGGGLAYELHSPAAYDEVRIPDRHDLYLEADGPLAEAFNVWDAGVSGAVALRMTAGVVPAEPLRWRYVPESPAARGRTRLVEGRAFIDVDDAEGSSDTWDDAILVHHYAHFALGELSRLDGQGGAHDPSHRLAPADAWAEGASTFLAALATGSPLVLDAAGDDLRIRYDIETLSDGIVRGTVPEGDPAGPLSEGVVAAALWDLADRPADTGDGVADPEGVFDAILALGEPGYIDVGARGMDLQDALFRYACAGGDAARVDAILRELRVVPVAHGCAAP